MSTAWETTTDDVNTVLTAHGIKVSESRLEELHGELDHNDIEVGVLYFCSMNAQTNSMLSDIEDQLMRAGVIPKAEKKFVVDELDDTDDNDDTDDEPDTDEDNDNAED